VYTIQGDGTPGDDNSPGTGTTARFFNPLGIGMGPDGNVWIGDSENHRIRALDPYIGSVGTVVGSTLGYLDAPLPFALLNHPWDVEAGADNRDRTAGRGATPIAFISDNWYPAIRAVGENTPPSARIGGPYSVGPGDGLFLDGSKSLDPDILLGDYIADWAWDLDNDGGYDRNGKTLQLSPFEVWWYFGDSRPGVTYPYTRRIVLQVRDIFWETDTASTLVTVTGDLALALRPTLMPEPAWTKGTENRLDWTAVDGATAYELQWSRGDHFGVIAGALVTPDLTGLATGLSHNGTYYYRVRGVFGQQPSSPQTGPGGFLGPWSNVEFSTQDARAPESAFAAPSDPLRSNTARTRLPWTSTESGSGFANMSLWYSYEGSVLTRYPGRWRADSVTPLPGNNEEQATGTLLFDVAQAGGDGSYELWLSGRDNVTNDETTAGYRDLRLIVDSTAPAISDIRVLNITHDSADISWKTSERATCELAYGETVPYTKTLTTGPGLAHSVHLDGLTKDTEYHFNITATDGFGNPTESGDQSFRTVRPPPPVISNVQVTNITKDSADVSWDTDKATTGVVDYGQTTAYGLQVGDPVLATSHSVRLSGLSWGTLYHLQITATDDLGESSQSPDQTFRTVQPLPPVISDIQVLNLTSSSADISWQTDKLSTGVVDYGQTTAYGSQISDPRSAKTHRVHLGGLPADSVVHFEITATDQLGLSSKSGDQSFRTNPGRPPAPVLAPEPRFTAGTSNSLSWTAAQWATKYRLEVSTDAQFNSPRVVETTGLSLTVRNLSDGVQYFYRVAGVNALGVQGRYSNVESSAQDASPPETSAELLSVPTAAGGADIRLKLTASDATSGVNYLLLFYSKDRGRFVRHGGRIDPATTEVVFDLQQQGGGHYAFYTIGVDNVGNREAVPATLDVEVDVRIPTALAYAGDYGTTAGQDALVAAALNDAFGNAVPGASLGYTLGPLSGVLPPTDSHGLAQVVTNVALSPGAYDLELTYAGTTTLAPSSTKIVFVVKPVVVPPAPRVDVVGKGKVVDPSGQQFSFDLNVSSNPLTGTVKVTVGGKVLQATTITSVNAAGNDATITGIATVNGSGAERFAIRVTDGSPDRFGFTATDGTFVVPTDLSRGTVSISRSP